MARKQCTRVQDRPDYRFVLDDKGIVVDIVTERRRSSNRIVEEAMITSNLCAAVVLKEKLGFGVFNVHMGFEPCKLTKSCKRLKITALKQRLNHYYH